MKQFRFILTGILWMQVLACFSQKTEFLSGPAGSLAKVAAKAPFHYIEDGLDTTLLSHVARVRVASPGKPSITTLYRELETQSRKAGANGFRLVGFDQPGVAITADLYLVGEDMAKKNDMLKPRNTIYVFAGDPYERTVYDAFEFNGGVQNLRNGTYFKYILKEGEKAKLKKGTVTGTTMWISWKPDQLPGYYSIRGFGEKTVVKRTSVSKASRPGKFIRVDRTLGAMLAAVLTSASR